MRITAFITLEAGKMVAPVMQALSNSFATPDAASTLLGITVVRVISLESTNANAPSPPPVSSKDEDLMLPLWALVALLPLVLLPVAALVLLYRRLLQLVRDRANVTLSRDRANIDLQISVHVNDRLQRAFRACFRETKGNDGIGLVQREQAQVDDAASLSSSVPSGWCASLSNGRRPPSTLPPGPPSSSTGQSVVEQEMEAALTDLMADEAAVLELHSPPARTTSPLPEMAAGVRVVRQRVVAHRVQEAVNSTPPTPPEATLMPDAEWLTEIMCNELDEDHNDGGAGSEPQEPHLTVGPPGSLDPDQGSMTPRQRALHVARQRLQIARTSIESFQIVQTLAVALGAIHVEGGTIKALHAVLLRIDRPGMSEQEACTSTGASLSSFQKWGRRVQHARLDLPPPL